MALSDRDSWVWKAINLIRALVIMYLLLYIGEWIAKLIPFGIPGSIYGLLLLFFGLTTHIVRLEWVYFGASLLIRYMAVLFVPVSVGIMKYADLLTSQAKALLIPNVVSTCVTLVALGFFADYLFSLSSFTRKRKKVIKRRSINSRVVVNEGGEK
ncbi:CidA/LrgA family protein [Pasteurellaceae bacterium LIM206]|nr:CidA/LrgA family protein [Pasteurellaceae bacterium LIM206]